MERIISQMIAFSWNGVSNGGVCFNRSHQGEEHTTQLPFFVLTFPITSCDTFLMSV